MRGCRITPNSSDSQKTSDSPSRSASFGLRQGLPPLSPMSGDVTGRMLRASDLVSALPGSAAALPVPVPSIVVAMLTQRHVKVRLRS